MDSPVTVHEQKTRLACLDAATRMSIPGNFQTTLKQAELFYLWVTQTQSEPEVTDPPNLGRR